MRSLRILALLPALLLCAVPTLTVAADVSFSVSIAPPELPVYEQPPLPEPGYLWSPGYWAWDGMDYYWVPGTWVLPPASDMLWTPGYWGWRDGFYGWSPGYWGPEVGYYGGVNYGYGYTGVGYQGGYWHGGAFFYNRSVANFGRVNIVNVYSAPIEIHERSRISFNGGQGGLHWRPSPAERTAMTEHHRDATPMQRQHEQRAETLPALHASQNGGRPQILTTQRPADFDHPGPGLHNHQQPVQHAQPEPRSQPGAVAHAMEQQRQEGRGAQLPQAAPQHQPGLQHQAEPPRQAEQPHFAAPGPAMRGPDRQEAAPRPQAGGSPQGQPREQAPRPPGTPGTNRRPPGPQHEQKREPEPKHEN